MWLTYRILFERVRHCLGAPLHLGPRANCPCCPSLSAALPCSRHADTLTFNSVYVYCYAHDVIDSWAFGSHGNHIGGRVLTIEVSTHADVGDMNMHLTSQLEGKTEVSSWWKESVWHQLILIQTCHSTCLEGKSRWGLIPPVIPSTSAFSHWAHGRVTCPVEGRLLVDCI